MNQNSELIYDYYAIIPHLTEPRVLMLSGEDGWSLPHFSSTENNLWQSVSHVNQAMCDQWGLNVTTLRCVRTHYDRQTKHIIRIYAMENHSPHWRPLAPAHWVSHAELEELPLAMFELRSALDEWFPWCEEALASIGRVPWYRPGWFDIISRWIHEEFNRLGLKVINSIRQVRSWERSSLWEVKTNGGCFYFKAVPHMFAHEPRLTQWLARQYPANLPHIVAINARHHWMLMSAVEGYSWEEVGEIKRWKEALSLYAQMQVALVHRINQLFALGCPDRQLTRLILQVDLLLEDIRAMHSGQPGSLSEVEIERLYNLRPRLKEMLVELSSYGIPQTLEHGDLWPGQIIFAKERPVYIDWSDSAVAHPFFSLNFLSDPVDMQPWLKDIPDAKDQLLTAYLEPWTTYESTQRLKIIFSLADRLAPLYYAISYDRSILPRMEMRWEMENMLPFYLRKLLKSLED